MNSHTAIVRNLVLAILAALGLSACGGAGSGASASMGPLVLGTLEADPGKDRNQLPFAPVEIDYEFDLLIEVPLVECVNASHSPIEALGYAVDLLVRDTLWNVPVERAREFDWQMWLEDFANDPIGTGIPLKNQLTYRTTTDFQDAVESVDYLTYDQLRELGRGPNSCSMLARITIVPESELQTERVSIGLPHLLVCNPDPTCESAS